MKILVVRHGETDWNKANRVQGATDNPLNETGFAQAAKTGEALKGRRIDKVYTSPLIRARQTTQEIVKALGLNCPVEEAEALREQNFGIFEGWQRDDPIYQKEKHLIFKRFENGESFLDVAARVYPFLDQIIAQSNEDDVILLSCHGGIVRMIASYFQDLNNEEFTEYFAKNCEAAEFEVDLSHWIPSEKRAQIRESII